MQVYTFKFLKTNFNISTGTYTFDFTVITRLTFNRMNGIKVIFRKAQGKISTLTFKYNYYTKGVPWHNHCRRFCNGKEKFLTWNHMLLTIIILKPRLACIYPIIWD